MRRQATNTDGLESSPGRRAGRRLAACCLVGALGAGAPALAQPGAEPEFRRRQPPPPPAAPTVEVSAAPARPDAWSPQDVTGQPVPPGSAGAPMDWPEGTFIVRRRGTLVPSALGPSVFVLHPVEGEPRPRPLLVLPCRQTTQLESAARATTARPVFVLTGQVFQYRGQTYILPSAFDAAPAEPKRAAEPAPAPSGDTDEPEGESVERMIREIEAGRSASRALGRRREASADAPSAEQGADGAPLRADGSLLVRRRGRVLREPSGTLVFRFDADGDAGLREPPMTLLPCLLLERIEALVEWRGESLSYEMSGRVTAYDGRNYLLPTMFRVLRESELERTQ